MASQGSRIGRGPFSLFERVSEGLPVLPGGQSANATRSAEGWRLSHWKIAVC